jgi:predicted nuclease of predicted toxin-antitoxin system
MLRLATDEDFNNRIVRGLLRRQPDLDILRVQDAGLAGKSDEDVLAWAASEGRILITHDVTTMIQTAYDRISAGLPQSKGCLAIAARRRIDLGA